MVDVLTYTKGSINVPLYTEAFSARMSMKKCLVLFVAFILGCSENAPSPAFESFKLLDEGRFEICFQQPFAEHEVMLALEILNKDGTVIDRKWHDEYQVLYDGGLEGGSKCHDSAFVSFMSASNSTPEEVKKTLHNHKDSMIKEIIFYVATSKSGNYHKLPDAVYIAGIYDPVTNKSRLIKSKNSNAVN